MYRVVVDYLRPFSISNAVELVTSSTHTVEWERSVGAVSYDVALTQLDDCSLVSYLKTNETSKTFTDLVPGNYHICLRATSSSNLQVNAENSGLSFVVHYPQPQLSFSNETVTAKILDDIIVIPKNNVT